MKHAQLLDCTLRDGAYLIDKEFGNEAIIGIINGLVDAHVDFIEIGFFQNDGFGDGKTVYLNSADAARFVPKDKGSCKFTVLADYSRYDVNNLDIRESSSVDAVRECFFKTERYDAIESCRIIKEKGYELFVQPVDILGYSDKELIELIEQINPIEPFCFSIVDTFGSMYQEQLRRVFEIVHHNLTPTCKIGFHSHNNMELSNALSQDFVRMTAGRRECIIDGTLNGMGRGAGNTPTELIAQYLVSQRGYHYNMDALLDVVDTYMDNIRARCSWGYSTPFFIAGCHSAHVNNISYLLGKNGIRSKDVSLILNKIGSEARKRYDYDLLEKTYLDVMASNVDDSNDIERLKKEFADREVLILVPGKSALTYTSKINDYIIQNDPIVISVNFLHDDIDSDYVYMSNARRYRYWQNSERFQRARKILSSNLKVDSSPDVRVVSALKLIKKGWEHLDNSTLMLLRLLDSIGVTDISIAGFDGYSYTQDGLVNYASPFLELSSVTLDPIELNSEISEMLADFSETKRTKDLRVSFITPSRFADCLAGDA